MPWKPGESGNPSGRPPEILEVRQVKKLCQEKTEEAIRKVFALMECADKDSVQLAAALAVLKIAGVRMDGEVTINVTPQAPRDPTREELAAALPRPSLPLN